jgi:hypothetical protein
MAIVAWLVAGHVILGGLYWALLQTPESNLFMLATSALLVVAMLLGAGIVEGVGLMGWQHPGGVAGLIGGVSRRVFWVVPALAVFAAIWWATGAYLRYFAGHAGEIDAWFIAQTGWVRTAWFHVSVQWIGYFLRFVVGTSLALSLFAAGLAENWAGIARVGWLARACSWRTLAIVGLALLAMWAGPWQLAYWRPSGLPSTWVQPTFAGAKLVMLFLVVNALWALVLWAIGRAKPPKGAATTIEVTEPTPAEAGPLSDAG